MQDEQQKEQGIYSYGERWSDEEIERFQKRYEKLRRGNGLNDEESERLAERMLLRDRP